MIKFLKIVIASLLYLSSRSPIISFTHDFSFHEMSFEDCLEFLNNYKDKSSINKIRFSLISFGFGETKIYLFTYNEKFSFFKSLRLNTIKPFTLSEIKYQRLKKKMKNRLKKKCEDDKLNNEIDYIKHKIINETQIEEKAVFKALAIKYILLAFIPSSLILEMKSVFTTSYLMTTIIIYSLGNIFLLISVFLKVGKHKCPRYIDLKNGNSSKKQLLINYYLEWQELKINADFLLSCTKNIERYFRIFFIAFTISLFLSSQIYIDFKKKALTINRTFSTEDIVINLNDGNFKKITKMNLLDLIKLNTLLAKDNSIKEIIISSNNKDNIYSINKEIEFYNLRKIKKSYFLDNKLENYEIKILLIKQ